MVGIHWAETLIATLGTAFNLNEWMNEWIFISLLHQSNNFQIMKSCHLYIMRRTKQALPCDGVHWFSHQITHLTATKQPSFLCKFYLDLITIITGYSVWTSEGTIPHQQQTTAKQETEITQDCHHVSHTEPSKVFGVPWRLSSVWDPRTLFSCEGDLLWLHWHQGPEDTQLC